MVYKVRRFSYYQRPDERLYAFRFNFKKLGKDVLKAPVHASEIVGTPIVKDAGIATNLVKEVVGDVAKTGKTFRVPRSGRDVKAAVLKGKRRVRDFWNGQEGSVLADKVGKHADTVDSLTGKAMNYVFNAPTYVSNRILTPVAQKLGVKDIAAPTTSYALYRKRLGQLFDVFNPKRAGHGKAVRKVEEIASNPGGFVSGRIKGYVKSGGDKLLDDYVTLDKLQTHLAATGGSPLSILQAGTGFYHGDVLRTKIRTAAAAMDQGLNRYVTDKATGKSIRLGTRYKAAARSLGNKFGKYVEEPLAKIINTGGVLASQAVGGPVPNYVYTGTAPMITGKTGQAIVSKVKSSAGSLLEGIKSRFMPRQPRVVRMTPRTSVSPVMAQVAFSKTINKKYGYI